MRHNVALDEDTGSFHHVVFQLGNTALGLHTFPQPPAPDDQLGIEHGGIKDASYGPGVSFRDADNNALEFFCPPST